MQVYAPMTAKRMRIHRTRAIADELVAIKFLFLESLIFSVSFGCAKRLAGEQD
jgi:hypothetical protein